MRLHVNLTLSILMLVSTPIFALQLLSHPIEQPPECDHSYENTPDPKTLDHVSMALMGVCIEKDGVRVVKKEITTGNATEPTSVILSCIGEKPIDFTVFDCTYNSRTIDNLEE